MAWDWHFRVLDVSLWWKFILSPIGFIFQLRCCDVIVKTRAYQCKKWDWAENESLPTECQPSIHQFFRFRSRIVSEYSRMLVADEPYLGRFISFACVRWYYLAYIHVRIYHMDDFRLHLVSNFMLRHRHNIKNSPAQSKFHLNSDSSTHQKLIPWRLLQATTSPPELLSGT